MGGDGEDLYALGAVERSLRRHRGCWMVKALLV